MKVYGIHNGNGKYVYVGICTHTPFLMKNSTEMYKWLDEQKKIVIDVLETHDNRKVLRERELFWIGKLATEGHPLLNIMGFRRRFYSIPLDIKKRE